MSTLRSLRSKAVASVLAGIAFGALPDGARAAYPIAFGGSGTDDVKHTVVGASGDLYVAGTFSGNLSVVVGSATRVLAGLPDSQGNDVFVARLNPAGQVVWIARLGGLGDDSVDALTVDDDGNAFVAGLFSGEADFGSTFLTASSGGPDGYVARLDAAGNGGSGAVSWARRFGAAPAVGGADLDTVSTLVALPRGSGEFASSVVLVGSAACTAVFAGDNTSLIGLRINPAQFCTGSDVFAARLSSEGVWQWAYAPEGSPVVVQRTKRARLAAGHAGGRAFVLREELPPASPVTAFAEGFDALMPAGSTVELLATWGPKFIDRNGLNYRVRDYHDSANNAGQPASPRIGQLHGDGIAEISQPIDTRYAAAIRIAAVIRSGLQPAGCPGASLQQCYMEPPDAEDFLYIEYLNAAGEWQQVRRVAGGFGAGAVPPIDFSGANALLVTAADARHRNFKLRFRGQRGDASDEGTFADSWLVDNIVVELAQSTPPPDAALMSIAGLTQSRPVFGPEQQTLSENVRPRRMVADAQGPVYIAGDISPDAQSVTTICGDSQVAGALVVKFAAGGSICEWVSYSQYGPPENAPGVVFLQADFDGFDERPDAAGDFAVAPTAPGAALVWTRNREVDGVAGRFVQLSAGSGPVFGQMVATANTLDAIELELRFKSRPGPTDSWSDAPEPGDNLLVEYRDPAGAWLLLATLQPAQEPAQFAQKSIVLNTAGARHAGFQVRFRRAGAVPESGFADSWLIDDVEIVGTRARAFEVVAGGLALGQDGVFVSGTFKHHLGWRGSSVSAPAIQSHGFPEAASFDPYVLRIDSLGRPVWLTGGRLSDADGMPDEIGDGPGATSGAEQGGPIAISPGGGDLFVGGAYSPLGATFGPDVLPSTRGQTDGFVFNLRSEGLFYRNEAFVIGEPILPPAGAILDNVALAPEFVVGGVPFDAIDQQVVRWAAPEAATAGKAQLIALQPLSNVRIRWRTDSDPASAARVDQVGSFDWPTRACRTGALTACYQLHVAGAPVDVDPASGAYLLGGDGVVLPPAESNGAANDGGHLLAPDEGWSTLIYVNGPSPAPNQRSYAVRVMRSLRYDHMPADADPGPGTDVRFQSGVPAVVGSKLADAYHDEAGRTGYVVNERAYYDGVGNAAAYRRDQRSGAIVPVNVYRPGRPDEDQRVLAVAWYRLNEFGVYWPSKAVVYHAAWPAAPEALVIASQQGSAGSPTPLQAGGTIYVQNDATLPGFNPNDEHAFIAPGNGTPATQIFPLRADFGSGLPAGEDTLAASDPYVLYRWFDEATQERRFRVFAVLATDAGHANFVFSGTAGTPVAPPYPVRLLANCAQTRVIGEVDGLPPPLPFFRDYKNQLWARSAGLGSVLYHYPARPDFFVDNDRNGRNDIEPGDCVPLLARLPVAMGGYGSPEEPIQVGYDLVWPADAPLLTAGETLLDAKNSLPNIFNQAAVEVAYDALQNEAAPRPPHETVATLIDPLGLREVDLSQLPPAVASAQENDGSRSISGSADGTIKLPVSLRQRISYEPFGGKLRLRGVYDAGNAGEPLLLLNVLSDRDRARLHAIGGGDGAWDAAVDALYRLSRNPHGVTKVCEPANVVAGPGGIRACSGFPRAVNDSDFLIGVQDELPAGAPDGVLEPYQALGVSAALTAGLSAGNGYLTLAFNNDPSLTPAPVSLQVIRVGCLDLDVGPATNEFPYQGQIQVLPPDDIFDEQLTLRHSGDFGGRPDALKFEWFSAAPSGDGSPPPLPDPDNNNLGPWTSILAAEADKTGALEIDIVGADLRTLSDNYYLARYRGLQQCTNMVRYSLFAGSPGGTPPAPQAQLAEGWVKRVLARLNPFEARVQDFTQAATNTYTSMLVQLGERYAGPIALSSDPDYLNSIGLIQAYTTVLRRAMGLSVDSTPPVSYEPANNAILLVASRLVEFYTLLGNEAYADAQDPTIGIGTDGDINSLAPSIFNFQNQLDSPLSEELALLRGRDSTQGPVVASPIYNRLFWNFTRGDGEVAYANSYNITDQRIDGVIDERDARILFPQGHGDAWGHYLTASKLYYDLLRHPFYQWNPRAEAVLVAGVPLPVDYLDERQFAATAAAKARTGAEIVDLTYRASYVEDPAGQYQGYEDSDAERAWGLAEWGRRAGQGSYFDWVTGHAILPPTDPDPNHRGIQKIERGGVSELDEIASAYLTVQGKVDKADAGLNPLGLAKGVVPFDIDPSQLDRFNKTQFEQVYDRALAALKNARAVWDFANQLNNQLRRSQQSADDMYKASVAQETDFANRLIEIFGYPYADDIGAGKTYPGGYDGPDLLHYMYVDRPAETELSDAASGDAGSANIALIERFTGTYAESPHGIRFTQVGPTQTLEGRIAANGVRCIDAPLAEGCPLGDVPAPADSRKQVEYVSLTTPDTGTWYVKPPEWNGQRRAPGRLQQTIQQMLQGRIALHRATLDYDALRLDIEAKIRVYSATFNVTEANLALVDRANHQREKLSDVAKAMKGVAVGLKITKFIIDRAFNSSKECIPDVQVLGLAAGGDIFSSVKCALENTKSSAGKPLEKGIEAAEGIAAAVEAAKGAIDRRTDQAMESNNLALALFNLEAEIEALVRREPLLRVELYARAQALEQLAGDYQAALAEGLRTAEELKVFRRDTASEVQVQRYRDMAYRIFRNDALAKYRAAFDLAARYVYLAASAYDYETNLTGGDAKAGQAFLTNVVRERSIGQMVGGEPIPGSPGLADTMARLKANFDVLKGQMGFNNPQTETNRFSLRRELFRIPDGAAGDDAWREKLASLRVDNLWSVPEFRRYARPFAPETSGPQPGLVITFDTDVTFGLNYFGRELGPQDSSYDSSQFATRIRSVGAWFSDYAGLPLADDPRIYLFPVGADVLRAPNAGDFATREWQVVDQAIPVPFPIGSTQLANYAWNPLQSLSGPATELRRYARFRAYNYSEPFDDAQVTADSRLIGRSVWNRKWMLIIPGGTFLNDADAGLDTFIDGTPIPGGSARDGDGVDDIHIFFKTYAYSGQ
jgi:hypothetical protein